MTGDGHWVCGRLYRSLTSTSALAAWAGTQVLAGSPMRRICAPLQVMVTMTSSILVAQGKQPHLQWHSNGINAGLLFVPRSQGLREGLIPGCRCGRQRIEERGDLPRSAQMHHRNLRTNLQAFRLDTRARDSIKLPYEL